LLRVRAGRRQHVCRSETMTDVLTIACRPPRAFTALVCVVLSYWSVGCAQLLDLPSDPQLVDESAAMPAESGPVGSASDAPDSGAGSSGRDEPASSAQRPPPLFEDRTNTDPEPTASTTGDGTSDGDGPSGDGNVGKNDPGSGNAEVIAADAGASDTPPPEPEPVERCAAGETLGPNERCYFVVGTTLAWEDARANCLDRGAGWDLAAIRSSAVNQFLGELVTSQAWIGASDLEQEGTWVWVNANAPFWSGTGLEGNSLNGEFESWNSDEPNGRGNSDCARLVPVGTGGSEVLAWADLECFELRESVCEGPAR